MAAETQAQTLAATGLTPGERTELQAAARDQGRRASASLAIIQRELTAMFYSPIAYVVGFAFLLLTGYFFLTETLTPGNEASLRLLFERMAGVLVFALPLLTMRSVAEEFATHNIETLMTAPVTDLSVVLGKFFGTLLFYLALLGTTLVHLWMMGYYADPVWGVVFSGYLGMVLLGALFLAIGIFASSCTQHQLLAAVIAIAILAVLTFVADYGAEYAGRAWQRNLFAYLSILTQFDEFGKGIIELGSVVYFLTGTAFFLFLATKVLESRRWR